MQVEQIIERRDGERLDDVLAEPLAGLIRPSLERIRGQLVAVHGRCPHPLRPTALDGVHPAGIRVPRPPEVLDAGHDVYAYFNNHWFGHAVSDARLLRADLDPVAKRTDHAR